MIENTKKPMIKGNSSKILFTTLFLIMLKINNLGLFKIKERTFKATRL
jgi:hypothetical protein